MNERAVPAGSQPAYQSLWRKGLQRRGWTGILCVLFLMGLVFGQANVPSPSPATAPSPAAERDGISVFFSPHGGCTDAIVAEIAKSKQTLLIQAYQFTSTPIAKAVLEAHKRGVAITAVLDASQRTSQYSSATFLANQGIAVYIDPAHAIAHNKIMLVDGNTIVTGSFNFSKNAEDNNAENLLIVRDKPEIFAAYETNFRKHLKHSVKYDGPASTAPATMPTTTVAPASQSAPATQAEQIIVHVTKSGKKYHREGCKFVAKSDIPMPLSDAKAKGYTPCSVCSPPP